MPIPAWMAKLTGANEFAMDPNAGFQPNLGDAMQGIGHSMGRHYRGEANGPHGDPSTWEANQPTAPAGATQANPLTGLLGQFLSPMGMLGGALPATGLLGGQLGLDGMTPMDAPAPLKVDHPVAEIPPAVQFNPTASAVPSGIPSRLAALLFKGG